MWSIITVTTITALIFFVPWKLYSIVWKLVLIPWKIYNSPNLRFYVFATVAITSVTLSLFFLYPGVKLETAVFIGTATALWTVIVPFRTYYQIVVSAFIVG